MTQENHENIGDFLREKTKLYNNTEFIETDPIQIPRSFTSKEDIEISAFLTSVISWGQRKTIISNSKSLMEMMDDSPGDFILHHSESDLAPLEKFVHRTFNGDDLLAFISGLRSVYAEHGGLEAFIEKCFRADKQTPGVGWSNFKTGFFGVPHLPRTQKHLPNPLKGSAAKRMNMFLRWMVRSDDEGVDFGIWKSIKTDRLYIPLDVHSGRVARRLGLLHRKQNDWKAVIELTEKLREFDPVDPVRFDFALFGLGVFEKY